MHAFITSLFVSLLLQPQESLEDLVSGLSAPDIEARERAVERLIERGDPAIPAVERALLADSPELRLRARQVLQQLNAPSALLEDLRSDTVKGNALNARGILLDKWSPRIKELLLEAVSSDDTQQALQAAYLLIRKGYARAALKANPLLLQQSIAAFCREGETRLYERVAGVVMLRLGATLGSDELKANYARGLRGVTPSALDQVMLWTHSLAGTLKVPFPRPLMEHYLGNLRDDTRWNNAYRAGLVLKKIRSASEPYLREMVKDRDRQGRCFALSLLIDFDPDNLPEGSEWVLGEMIADQPGSLVVLLKRGGEAVPVLLEVLRAYLEYDSRFLRLRWMRDGRRAAHTALNGLAKLDRSELKGHEQAIETICAAVLRDRCPVAALRAGRMLVRIDRPKWEGKMILLAVKNLRSDDFEFNLGESVRLLIEIGAAAHPDLHRALESPDEQQAVSAAGILSFQNAAFEATPDLNRKVFRMARREWLVDESSGLRLLLLQRPEILRTTLSRLRKSGKTGMLIGDRLEESIEASRKNGWKP